MSDRKARYDRRQKGREDRLRGSERAGRARLIRTLLIFSGGLGVAVIVGAGLLFWAVNQKVLPPTGEGARHAETLPPSQINLQPIPIEVQRHVMERNSSHPVGRMLVQYNCEQYECEPGLVDSLIDIVEEYPPSVYMAPYPGMDAKIALAAPGRLVTMDQLDSTRVRQFIVENLRR